VKVTKYEQAVREYNGYTTGARPVPRTTTKGVLFSRQKLQGCSCNLAWWRLNAAHLISARHLAVKHGISESTLRMLIQLVQLGESHVPELCAVLDVYENLMGKALTYHGMLDVLRQIQGGNGDE
jgi:hypothetical protein